MRLVQTQPLPIRLVLGPGTMLVFPIPLWGYVESGAKAYHLIESWQGVYMVLITPLVFAGGWLAVVVLVHVARAVVRLG